MNSLGTISAYSAYAASASFLNTLAPVSPLKAQQEPTSAENSATPSSIYGEINDEAIVSDAAKALLAKEENDTQGDLSAKDESKTQAEKKKSEAEAKAETTAGQAKKELTAEEQQQVKELKARDAEVKAHEQAHLTAAAGIGASAPSYEYQRGPDGQKYAVGGEVNLSFSKGSNPEDTIAKAEAMRAAALAPAQPSGQDLSVARDAQRMIQEAKQQESADAAKASEETQQPVQTEEAGESAPTQGEDGKLSDKKVGAEESPISGKTKTADKILI